MAKDSGFRRNGEEFSGSSALDAERRLPYNSEAESGVIGAILLNPAVFDDVAMVVRQEDFFSESNQRIFRHLADMNAEGKGIDLTLLTDRLRRSGEMEEIGGEAYLGELMTSVQVTAHAVHYAEIVRDKAILRSLITTSSQILSSAYESGKSPRELISLAEENIFRIGDARGGQSAVLIKDFIESVFDKIDSMAAGGMDGVPTGFTKLDEMLNGLHASELIILAARPSMGKTALATNIADYVAVEAKQPVLFFSLEMSKMELAIRMLCARGRIPSHHLKGNFLTGDEQNRFMQASSELADSMLYIDESSARTVSEIAAVARRIKRQGGLGLIVIDYLTLIEPDNPSDPRQEQVAKIARRLKGLARELDVPVLCLAQVNRQVEANKDPRPRLSHLRESGAIEQDADVVMFVHREEYYQKDEEAFDNNTKGVAEIIVAKQRNGPTGTVELRWNSECTLFMNEDEGEYSDPGDYPELGSASVSDF